MIRLTGRRATHGPRWWPMGLLWCVAGLGAGCQGEIHAPHQSPLGQGAAPGNTATASDGVGTTGVGSAGVGGSSSMVQDEMLRDENPELLDVALEYFPGQADGARPARLFRLTRAQLDRTTETLLPEFFESSVTLTMPRDPLEKNYEYSANLSFNPANFTPYTAWVRELADRVRANPTGLIDCDVSDPTCLETESRAFVQRAFRHVPDQTVVDRYTSFFVESTTELGLAEASGDLVELVLSSPHYVFRDEVGTDERQLLLPAQLLQHVSYTLADAPPERVGLGPPGDSEVDLAATVAQVLQSDEARDKLLRFFLAWLEVREPDEFDISESVFPEWTPEVAAAAVEETTGFLERQLTQATPVLKDVTESTQSLVSERLVFVYGIEASDAGLVQLDPSQRLGIFTQPAVIASHSGPTSSRLVKRGVFFTRKIMCLPLGTPPEDIDTSVPQDAGATERERIETVTQPSSCANCHAYINPFGFMQENYDAIGRYRTEDEEGQPIDASIDIDFLDEGPLSSDSLVEALQGLTQSLLFQQCFTRQLFRFYTGRDEAAQDDPLLRQMFFHFANNQEQQIVTMLRTLVATPSYSLRQEAP